jgi:DNA (cytosine-5)-methyltransferase 1
MLQDALEQTIAIDGNGQRPSHKGDGYAETDKSYTLNATEVHGVVYALDRASYNQGKNAQFDIGVDDKGIAQTVVAKGPGAVAYSFDPGASRDVGVLFIEECAKPLTIGTCPGHHDGVVVAVDCRNGTEDVVNDALQSNSAHSLNGNNVVRTRYIVRRLTPLECERLQGYPDGWTDIGEWIDSNGKKRQTSDASRYRALGNSIALPPWKWLLKRLCACYERDATMASLFSGIGGFDLLWTQLNGMGSVLWESEIEDFPSAVTRRHFGDEDTGEKGDFYEFFN